MFSDRVLTVATLLKLYQDSMYIVVGSIVEICKELCSLLGNEDNSEGFRWNNSDILNHLVKYNYNTTMLFWA